MLTINKKYLLALFKITLTLTTTSTTMLVINLIDNNLYYFD